MRVLIIEDEAPAFRRLQRILESLRSDIEIIDVLDSVVESIKWFTENDPPDLVFMDIQLADGLSFEIFDSVEIEVPIIFTTAYDEYAIKAFKVNSIDYLLKPIDEELLHQGLIKFEKQMNKPSTSKELKEILHQIQPEVKEYKSRFLVKSMEKLISIPIETVAYFYTENSLVYLMTKSEKKHVFDKPLDHIEAQLNPKDFFRLNRQILVQINAINASYAYDKGKIMVELTPNLGLPTIVSKERSSEFKRWLDLN